MADSVVHYLSDLGPYSAKEGRPSYPPVMMLKVLLHEQSYNLSDPQMEEALNDRMAFRRFVGLEFQEEAPDYSTRLVSNSSCDELKGHHQFKNGTAYRQVRPNSRRFEPRNQFVSVQNVLILIICSSTGRFARDRSV